MYGDVRHIFVMQSETENEVDFGEIQHSADKYSKAFNSHHNQRQAKAERKTAKSEERKNYRNGDTSEPHFRPVGQRPINNKQRTKPPKVADKSPLIDNQINSNGSADEMKSKLTPESASEVSGKTTKLTSITSPSSTTPDSIKSTSEESSTKESDRKTEEAVDKAVFDLFSNISSVFSAASTTTTQETSSTTTSSKAANENTQEPSITERTAILEGDEEVISEEIFEDSLTSSSTTTKEPIATTTTEALLFQDSMIVQIPTNKRGV